MTTEDGDLTVAVDGVLDPTVEPIETAITTLGSAFAAWPSVTSSGARCTGSSAPATRGRSRSCSTAKGGSTGPSASRAAAR
ncbi:hypothetical protein ACFQ0M_40500 [Kitasatospora aburaviensis]